MSATFMDLQQQANEEEGHDAYNGTIATIDELSDNTKDYARSGLPVGEYLNGLLLTGLAKREAVGVCLREPHAGRAGEYVFAGWAVV